MDMTLSTPALLFPAISLLLLAYTNRFAVLTKVIRDLRRMASDDDCEMIARQLKNLRTRLQVIRIMQASAVLAFVVCTLSIFCLYLGWQVLGETLFGASLLLLVMSLLFSLYEVQVSTVAISIELEGFEK